LYLALNLVVESLGAGETQCQDNSASSKEYSVAGSLLDRPLRVLNANLFPKFKERARQFEATEYAKIKGVTIQVVDLDASELGAATESSLSGPNDADSYDFFVMGQLAIGDYASKLADLTPFVEADTGLDWEDVFGFIRENGCKYDGRLVLMPLDGDMHFLNYRKDILERDGHPFPNSIPETVELAKLYNGTDLNDDGQPDYGFCHWFGDGTEPNKHGGTGGVWWEGMCHLSYIVQWLQYNGTQQGALFDPENFDPLINTPAAAEGLRNLRTLLREGSDYHHMRALADFGKYGFDDRGTLRDLFVSGRCLFFLDWANTPVLTGSRGLSWISTFLNASENSTSLPYVGNKAGVAAVPGAPQIWDRQEQALETCDAERCPHGRERDGKTANVAPFAALGGWGVGLHGDLSGERMKAAYKFIAFMANPVRSIVDALDGTSGFDPFRFSSLDPAQWEEHGMDPKYAEAFTAGTREMYSSRNVVQDVALPRMLLYHAETANAFRRFFDAPDSDTPDLTAEQVLEDLVKDWDWITTSRTAGRQAQLAAYRNSLGIKDPDLINIVQTTVVQGNTNIVIPVIIAIACVLAAFLIGAAAWWVITTYREKVRMRKLYQEQQEKILNDKLDGGLSSVQDVGFPMSLISARCFMELESQELMSLHEGVRNTGKLIVLDTMALIMEFRAKGNMIVFFSYQWLSWDKPGPDSVQHSCMIKSLETLSQKTSMSLQKIFVWLDILSIPQCHPTMKSLAVNSLYVYASRADHMVIIGPTSVHASTGQKADLESYKQRVWCRAEQMAHCCNNSLETMYLATEGGLQAVPKDWMKAVCQVFNGDMTCCRLKHPRGSMCDKESLVPSLLALYFDLYLQHVQGGVKPHLQDLWGLIQDQKDAVFPSTFEYSTNGGMDQRELFGSLIERLERYVDTSPEKAKKLKLTESGDLSRVVASPSNLGLEVSVPLSSPSDLEWQASSAGQLPL